jgi:hypothetical protein
VPRDNSPKERYQHQLARKQNKRAPYDRILVVCEGSKTEPNYFKEIKSQYQLQSANIQILPSAGTSPLQVVEYAEKIFRKGDLNKGIAKRAFDRVYAVFDCDSHPSYNEALTETGNLDNKLRNDNNQKVRFRAIPSNPCFELWLLLHYQDAYTLTPSADVLYKLKAHFPAYTKSAKNVFEQTRNKLSKAIERAERLKGISSPTNTTNSYTGVHELVKTLTTLKD